MNLNKIIHTLGPDGSFHQLSLLYYFPEANVELHEQFDDVFRNTQNENWAWIAVRNSLAGVVANHAEKIESCYKLYRKEVFKIELALATKELEDFAFIDQVFSHPKALEESSLFLKEYIAQARQLPFYSTAAAAKSLSEGVLPPNSACICHPLTAEKYGLKVLKNSIENLPDNHTEFWLFGDE